jgi:uncharacterized protein YndB with AHSA1/START domain
MDIIHGLEIETTAEKLFAALSTDRGIAAWWTKAKTQPKVGGINEFAFGSGVVTFRVEKLEPGKAVAWAADQVPPDWKGTQVRFELSDGTGGGTVSLRFSHTGFKTMTPVVAFTSYAWAQFLRSLKLLLETGQGEPFGSPASLAAGTTPRG